MITTSEPQPASVATTPLQPPAISEDWLAVGIAFALIGLVLAGVRPPLPTFSWASPDDLTSRILGSQNLQRSVVAGIAIGVFAVAGAWLMRASLARFIAGFGVVYALTWAAQLIAGSALIGQGFNVIWTLLLAYLFFGGIFFAAPVFH